MKTEYRTHREFKSFLNQITICDFSSVQIKGKLNFGTTGRINWLSSLTSLPYSDLNITTIAYTHTHTHAAAQRGKVSKIHTGVKSRIYIFIYFNHYPFSNRWSHTMSTILHNKSLFFIWKTKVLVNLHRSEKKFEDALCVCLHAFKTTFFFYIYSSRATHPHLITSVE